MFNEYHSDRVGFAIIGALLAHVVSFAYLFYG
jgi:hypothetical protein